MKNAILNPMLPHKFTIKGIRKELHDTFTLELESANGNGKQQFLPGQFNMLYVFGVGEVPISISGDPLKSETLIHTVRVVGAVTKALSKLKAGGIVGLRGPFGNHWPLEKAKEKDVVIVAGGIGLAPLRGAVYELIANKKNYNKILLLYGSRTPADLLYTSELKKWSSQGVEVHITVDSASKAWKGNVGVVTTLIPKATFNPKNILAMICGPEIMMRFTIQELIKSGISGSSIYISMERNMKCAVGFCGHCQYGHTFICKDGPVFPYDKVKSIFGKREI